MELPWEKCCSLTTDRAAMMTGRFSGVGACVKEVATDRAGLRRGADGAAAPGPPKNRPTTIPSQ